MGQGSFGKVYQAEMLSGAGLVRPVALKVYLDQAQAPEEGLQRFRDEARLMARVSHRALVQVIDLIQLPMGWTIVMEWVEGVDATELTWDGAVPPRVVMSLVADVAGALAAAWDATNDNGTPLRLIHRDIKPSNLRISLHGDVRLLDFGAARGDIEGREANTSQWRLGTLPYMAPERMEEGLDGPACDIFSLGLVALDLMRGTPRPSVLPRAVQLQGYLQLLEEELRHGAGLDEVQTAAVAGLIGRMIANDHAQRPDARAVADDAHALVDRLPGPRAATWLGEQARRLAAQRPAPALEDAWTGRVVSRRIRDANTAPSAEAPVDAEAMTELMRTPVVVAPPAPSPGTVAVQLVGSGPVPSPVASPSPAASLSPVPATPRPGRAPWIAGVVALGLVGAWVGRPAPAPPVSVPTQVVPVAPVLPVPPVEEAPAPKAVEQPAPPVARVTAPPAPTAPRGAQAVTKPAPGPLQVEAPPPPPPPPPPSDSVVSVAGGLKLTATLGAERHALPAKLRPGTWSLTDAGGNAYGTVSVGAGESFTLVCNPTNNRCSKR